MSNGKMKRTTTYGIGVLTLISLLLFSCKENRVDEILHFKDFDPYIQSFNQGDNELYIQHIPNDEVADFLADNIPLVDLPDKELEKTYYFRWWTYRKHIKSTEDGFVVTEFLPPVSWAGKHNTINCPAGHQIYEGRWLRDPMYMENYLNFWLNHSEKGLRSYSFWIADAMLAFSQVHRDDGFIREQLPSLISNYASWEEERREGPDKLFWQTDSRDGMELTASGRILNGGKSIFAMDAVRPTINSYMYGDAKAIAVLNELIGNLEAVQEFETKADFIKSEVQTRLWNDSLSFFTVLPKNYGPESTPLNVRELIGYVPWYFSLPDDKPKFAEAWSFLMDSTAFYAPFGLTVCEQSHPYFQIAYEGHECQWNGPSWPLATSQTLKALARLLNEYDHTGPVDKSTYFTLLKQYATSHIITLDDGETRPWIDENLNPFTGDWISRTRLKYWDNGTWSADKGGVERGKDYNHSSFCDLIISDLIGFKPQLDGSIVIQPLVPDDWEYFCLDKVNYQGKALAILWDETGERYGRGKGLKVFYDGKLVFEADDLEQVLYFTPDD